MKCVWQWAGPHRPDPGRRARFSSLAPVLALIVGALGLFVAAPASAQDAPSVPRNVQVTPGDGKLTLTWQAPSSWGPGSSRFYSVQWKLSSSPGSTWADVRDSTHSTISLESTATSVALKGSQEVDEGRSRDHLVTNGTSYDLRIQSLTIVGSFVYGSAWVTLSNQVPGSANADLSGLTASAAESLGGTYSMLGLTPSTFSASTASYTATVPHAITHVKLTPTVADAAASVTVDGTTVNSGSDSGVIALEVGANAITVRVTAENLTSKDYTVTVTRQAASSNADLSALTASASRSAGGTFSALRLRPSTFSPSTTSYRATVPNTTTHVKLTPTVSQEDATVRVDGTAVRSGSDSGVIALEVGANVITVRVTAEDGTTTTP